MNSPRFLLMLIICVLVISSVLATVLNNSSWFSLLLLATIYCALSLRPRAILLTSVLLVGYTAAFNLILLDFDFSVEIIFVSLVWIIAAVVTSTMRSLQHELKIRESYYRNALALSPGAMITLDPDHIVREWNRSAEELFGYSEAEARGLNIDSLICNDDPHILSRARAISKRVTDQKTIEKMRDVRYTKEGEAKQLLISGAPIQIDGEFHGVVASYTDISELADHEASIRSLVQQKELLLKEVHHRVKNHMQSLIAMLNLYLHAHDETAIKAELIEIQHKIQVMQSIYQHLYVEDHFDTIIIADLIGSIIDEYRSSLPLQNTPAISLSTDKVPLATDQALQIGIITNELLTNAVKYAKPERGLLTVQVSIRSLDQNRLELSVRDNGRQAIDLTPKEYGFGLQLVEGYARQYDGQLRIERSNGGNSFTVEIGIEETEA